MDIFELDGKRLGTVIQQKSILQKPKPKPEQPKLDQPAAPTPGEESNQQTGGRYIIQNITPMFPGWLACYDDPDVPEQVIMFPIVALAMVLLQHPDGSTEQTIRHLVSTPAGQIDDLADFPHFICVIAPGQAPNAIVPAMRKMRDAAT